MAPAPGRWRWYGDWPAPRGRAGGSLSAGPVTRPARRTGAGVGLDCSGFARWVHDLAYGRDVPGAGNTGGDAPAGRLRPLAATSAGPAVPGEDKNFAEIRRPGRPWPRDSGSRGVGKRYNGRGGPGAQPWAGAAGAGGAPAPGGRGRPAGRGG